MIENYGKVINDAPIKNHTTYKLSGQINKVIYPKDLDHLIKLLKYLKKEKIKYLVIGNGSNLIFTKDYKGVVIKLDNFKKLNIDNDIVKVEAGYNLAKLAIKTANMGLSGLEFASGIPASIGGAIYMNAGAYNSQIADIVKEVIVLDENFNIKTLPLKDLNFAYRHSIFKEKDYICLSVTLKLQKKNKDEILELINQRRQKRLETQPLNMPSAGSVFRNPENDYAGRLIEEAGLKGSKVGDAKVSEKHANFIVNTGSAHGKDIQKLIIKIQNKIEKEYGIKLKIEQEFIE